MSTPIKPYVEISHQLGASKAAWEKLVGYGKGLAKAVCSFSAKYILEYGKQATCNTEIDNISMSKVMNSLGMVAK